MFHRNLLPHGHEDSGNKPMKLADAISTTTLSTKSQQTATQIFKITDERNQSGLSIRVT
jgi:hypothetical protein